MTLAAHESDFESLKMRLDEIVELVSDDTLPLDDALKLYEEAVGIGLQASSLLEEDIAEHNAAYDAEQGSQFTSDSREDNQVTAVPNQA